MCWQNKINPDQFSIVIAGVIWHAIQMLFEFFFLDITVDRTLISRACLENIFLVSDQLSFDSTACKMPTDFIAFHVP